MERIVDRWLTLNIHPDVLRGMNRAEYKEVSRWLRLCQNEVNRGVTEKILHLVLYGSLEVDK